MALETLKTALSPGGVAPQAPVAQAPAPGGASGVSTFAPVAGARDVAGTQGAQGAQAAGGMDPALAATPAGEAMGALGMEQQRLQKEMHNFPDHMRDGAREHNGWAAKENAKTNEKLSKLDQDIAAERAKGGDPKKLKGMEEERAKVAKELKPKLEPSKVADEIEGVMNDPKIEEKDKKGKLEEIRNKYGLRESGGSLSMESFTNHLAQVREDSKSRVEGMQKSHMKELDAGIERAEKTFGKDSPQVKALREQKTGVDEMYSTRAKQLKDQAHAVYHTYHHPSLGERIGNFFKSIGNAIAAPFKAIGNVIKGIGEGIGKFFKGDFGGAFKSVAGGFKEGIGNLVDGVKSAVSGFGNLVSIAAPKVGEKINGFVTGLVDGVGNVVKGAFDTVTAIPQGLANGATRLMQGDVKGAFGAVGEGVKNAAETGFKTVKDGLPVLATAAAFVPGLQPIAIPLAIASSVQNGDYADALSGAAFGAAGLAAGRRGASAEPATRSTSARNDSFAPAGSTSRAVSSEPMPSTTVPVNSYNKPMPAPPHPGGTNVSAGFAQDPKLFAQNNVLNINNMTQAPMGVAVPSPNHPFVKADYSQVTVNAYQQNPGPNAGNANMVLNLKEGAGAQAYYVHYLSADAGRYAGISGVPQRPTSGPSTVVTGQLNGCALHAFHDTKTGTMSFLHHADFSKNGPNELNEFLRKNPTLQHAATFGPEHYAHAPPARS